MKNVLTTASLHLKKMGSISKTVLTLMVLALLSTSINAAANAGSTVTISSWDNKPFILEIDRKQYHTSGSITLTNLHSGNSRIKMIRKGNNSHRKSQSNRGLSRILYSGSINIPRNSRVRAEVDRNRRLNILDVRGIHSSQKPRRPQGIERPDAYNQGGECGANYEVLDNSPYMNEYGFEPYSYEATGIYGGAHAMAHSEFDHLIHSMEFACFSEEKLRIATQTLHHNRITSIQLNKLLKTLDFDSTKLELAKKAYKSVIDKENIRIVYGAFSFNSSVRKYESFIYAQQY